jgi:hypothetical protein
VLDTFEPVAVVTLELVADEAVAAEPTVDVACSVAASGSPTSTYPRSQLKRLSLAARRRGNRFGSAAEAVVESDIEAPVAEELFTPVFDIPPQFAWPGRRRGGRRRAGRGRAAVVEPVAADSIVVAPASTSLLRSRLSRPNCVTDVEQVTVDDAVADNRSLLTLLPALSVRRRRCRRGADAAACSAAASGLRARCGRGTPSEPVEVDARRATRLRADHGSTRMTFLPSSSRCSS